MKFFFFRFLALNHNSNGVIIYHMVKEIFSIQYILFYVFRCAYEILRRRDKNTQRSCPACNKLMNSRMHLSGSGSGVIPAETDSTDGGGSSAVNANVLSVDGLFGINSDILLPSTVFCNINRSMPLDTENVTLIMSPKTMYHSNLSLASLSMRASSLTIDSDRQNATSSV